MEKELEGLDRQRRAEERAKGSLQTFLDSSYKAVRATMYPLNI